MFEENLAQLGLSTDESQIYLSLLNKGPQSAAQLADSTKVKRTYVYTVAQGLIQKGLVKQDKSGRGTTFHPLSPDNLLDLAETQRLQIEQAKIGLENVLPQMKTLFSVSEEKPVISHYEGIEGIKKVYTDTIVEGKEILALVQNTEIQPELRQWLRETYLKKRVAANIKARVILASGTLSQMYIDESKTFLREVLQIPSQQFPLQHEVNVYGSKVAIMNYADKEKLLGIIIDNTGIANTFRAWFELSWLNAERLTTNKR